MDTSCTDFKTHIVIPTHGQPMLLERTLKSLSAIHARVDMRVWVVENGSDAGARQVCASFSADMAIEYVHLDKPGRSGAMQHMAERIGEGLLIFTDDDVRVSEGLVSAYAQAAQQHGERAVYGGPLSIDYESAPEPWLIEYLPPSAAGWGPSDPSAIIDRPSFLGANIALFAQTLLKEGGFNPALGVGSAGNPVGEEFDLQQRLFAKGYQGVYVPEARVWHYVPRSRCSARWALKRHERVWFTNGMMDTTVHDGPHIAGAPRWMWRQLISLGLQAAAVSLLPDARKRFEIKKNYYQHNGFMRGLRNH